MQTLEIHYDKILTIDVPERTYGTLDYKYAPLLRKIRLGVSSVTAQEMSGGVRYSFDPRIAGRMAGPRRDNNLKSAANLFMAAQRSAVHHGQLDPWLRLSASVTPLLGVYTVGAIIGLSPGAEALAAERQADIAGALADMTQALLNPEAPKTALQLTDTPMFEAAAITPLKASGEHQPVDQLRLEWRTASLEESFIKMAGATAMAGIFRSAAPLA